MTAKLFVVMFSRSRLSGWDHLNPTSAAKLLELTPCPGKFATYYKAIPSRQLYFCFWSWIFPGPCCGQYIMQHHSHQYKPIPLECIFVIKKYSHITLHDNTRCIPTDIVEMVLLGKDAGYTLYIILILLLDSTLVYLLCAPPSLLTCSFLCSLLPGSCNQNVNSIINHTLSSTIRAVISTLTCASMARNVIWPYEYK